MTEHKDKAIGSLEVSPASARLIEANIDAAASLTTRLLLPIMMFVTIAALVGCVGFAGYLIYALTNGVPGALEMLGFTVLLATPLAIGLGFQLALARGVSARHG